MIDRYPVPRIQDVLSILKSKKVFSKLDFVHAYQQVELEESSRPFTTISTHKGLFRYNRLSLNCVGTAIVSARNGKASTGNRKGYSVFR